MSGYNLSNIPRAAEHSLVGTSDMRTAVPSQSLFAPSTSVSFGLPPSVPAISSSPYVAAQQVTPNLYSNISFAPTQTIVAQYGVCQHYTPIITAYWHLYAYNRIIAAT